MRSLTSGLLTAQQAASGTPEVTITIGAVDYSGRLKSLNHKERPFGGVATILLNNQDNGVTADLRGDEVLITYGFSGETGSQAAPLYVLTQRNISREGEVRVELTCIDMWMKLSLLRIAGAGGTELSGTITGTITPDMRVTGQTSGATGLVLYVGEDYIVVSRVANGPFQSGEDVKSDAFPNNYISVTSVDDVGGGPSAAWANDTTILGIIQALCSGVVTVTLDSSDGIVDSRKPYYETEAGARAVNVIQDMVSRTKCGIRMENDGNLHLFDISSPPVSPDYTYDTDHAFWYDLRDVTCVLPNRVAVKSVKQDSSGVVEYSGSATDTNAYNRFGLYVTTIVVSDVSSDAEADEIAAAMLDRVQKGTQQGEIAVPMNCGQELFDYIRLQDSRAGLDYYGWVGSLEHIWEEGKYQLIIGLGQLSSAETLPSIDDEFPLPNLPRSISPRIDQSLAPPRIPPWDEVLPTAIQGYYHNITFSATDEDTVSWSSGTIKFYDGSTQSILSGNTGNLGDTALRYIYFDLDDASPNVLKVTTDYQSVMTKYTGLVCIAQKSSESGVKATFIPSYGKEPLITADLIDMTGLKSYTFGDGTHFQSIFSTQISAGYLKLTADTEKDGEWYDKSGVIIDATEGIKIYGGTGQALRTYPTKTDAQNNTNIQCYVGTNGYLCAGGGNLVLNEDGMILQGGASGTAFLTFKDSSLNLKGEFWGDFAGMNIAASGAGNDLNLRSAAGVIVCHNAITPSGTAISLGSTTDPWEMGYMSRLELEEDASPPSQAYSGHVALFAKTDGQLYYVDDAGNETGPLDSGGGGTVYDDDILSGTGFEISLVPDVDGSRGVGTSSKAWATAYINSIFFHGAINIYYGGYATELGEILGTAAGNVRIHSTNSNDLEITGARNLDLLASSGTVTIESSGGGDVRLESADDFYITRSGTGSRYLWIDLGSLGVIDFDGGAINPNTDEGANLGSSSKKWYAIYCDSIYRTNEYSVSPHFPKDFLNPLEAIKAIELDTERGFDKHTLPRHCTNFDKLEEMGKEAINTDAVLQMAVFAIKQLTDRIESLERRLA